MNINIFHICSILITLILVLSANSVLVNHYSESKRLAKEVAHLQMENKRAELEMELQEIEMVEFRQEVARVLPQFKTKASDYAGRQLASVLGGRVTPHLDKGFSKILLRNAKKDYEDQRYLKAKGKLKEYIDKYPQSSHLPEAYLMLLDMEFKQRNYEQTIKYIDHLVMAYPSNEITAHSLFVLGEIMLRQERIIDASELYRTIMDAFPLPQITSRAKKKLKEIGL